MKKFVLLLLCSSLLFANSMIRLKTYSLQKDETKKIIVKYAGLQKVFTFRWTLYKNNGLVVFSSYDEMVSQHMLYLNYLNQAFRVELKPRGAYEMNVPYMLVKFIKFDFSKHKAVFEIWLNDKRQEVFLKFL